MSPFDIIPDIHGQAAKLDSALAGLGWRRRALGWSHPDPAGGCFLPAKPAAGLPKGNKKPGGHEDLPVDDVKR